MTSGYIWVYLKTQAFPAKDQMLELSEPVNVWVFFKSETIRPYLMIWRGRKIRIDCVNLVHVSKNQGVLFYHFSVSAQGNFYKLGFDAGKMRWLLEAVEEG